MTLLEREIQEEGFPGIEVNSYFIGEELGAGGTATIYKLVDTKDKVIKIHDNLNEAIELKQIQAVLNSPAVNKDRLKKMLGEKCGVDEFLENISIFEKHINKIELIALIEPKPGEDVQQKFETLTHDGLQGRIYKRSFLEGLIQKFANFVIDEAFENPEDRFLYTVSEIRFININGQYFATSIYENYNKDFKTYKEYLDTVHIEVRNNPERRIQKVLQILNGIKGIAINLEVLAKFNIHHRDIKPSNLVTDRQGKPYLTDFGLSIFNEHTDPKRDSILGTLEWMSPEQMSQEHRGKSFESDAFSLAAIAAGSIAAFGIQENRARLGVLKRHLGINNIDNVDQKAHLLYQRIAGSLHWNNSELIDEYLPYLMYSMNLGHYAAFLITEILKSNLQVSSNLRSNSFVTDLDCLNLIFENLVKIDADSNTPYQLDLESVENSEVYQENVAKRFQHFLNLNYQGGDLARLYRKGKLYALGINDSLDMDEDTMNKPVEL